MTTPLYANDVATTLAAPVADGTVTTFTLASATGWPVPAAGQHVPAVVVDTSTSPETVKEYVWVTALSGVTATVTRQAEDAARFPAGALAVGLTLAAVATAEALAGSTFTPTDLSGCQVWLDATSLALADSDPVALWPDLSGHGYDVAQATADNQPVFKTAIQNGHGVVRFTDAVHPQFLAFSGAGLAALFNGWPSFTLAMVVKAGSTNASNVFSAIGTVGGGGNERVTMTFASGATGLSAAVDDTASPGTMTGVSWVTASPTCLVPLVAEWTGELPYALVTSSAAVDGKDFDVSLLGAAGSLPASACSSIQIGGEDITGFGQAGMEGDVGEVVIYNRALTSSERRRLLDYFSEKWGCL